MDGIKLLVTGGTLDKTYNLHNGELHFIDSHVPEILAEGRCHAGVETETLMLKDSLEMTDADRAVIADVCNAARQQRIVITHGTDTLTDTAEYLAVRVKDKTVVLLGAMVPWTIRHSDAAFNLGAAISAVQCLPAGVHVVMNGRIFAAGRVRKNREEGVFEAID